MELSFITDFGEVADIVHFEFLISWGQSTFTLQSGLTRKVLQKQATEVTKDLAQIDVETGRRCAIYHAVIPRQ